MARRSDPYLGF
ncbi:hypothetical protein Taro_023904 [Colocasia esculenta]|uniref:Uncharacterized protein n=1 Tax=Colocasia esculenta TaxID=4460 RepID=A0A843VFV5_COLES|nr:hypothetical protein [Colocasia esculenta]